MKLHRGQSGNLNDRVSNSYHDTVVIPLRFLSSSISNPINTHSIDTHLANDEGSHRHIKNIIHSVLANSSKNYDPIHYHIDGKLVRSVTAYTHKPSGQVFDHTVYHGPEGHESITSKSIKVFQ